MARIKGGRSDKKSNLGGSLTISSSKNTNPKKETRYDYTEIDRTKQNEKFTEMQTNQTSVIDQSDLQAFIDDAKLSNKNFTTERTLQRQMLMLEETGDLNQAADDIEGIGPSFVKVDDSGQKISKLELSSEELQNIRQNLLTLPRRPEWNSEMTKEELIQLENNSFLTWRRNIAFIEQGHNSVNNYGSITPFEKNLEFWRQLWRVIEYGNIVVQILDARNPLLFLNFDLIKYTQEIGKRQNLLKKCVLLLNKSDLLSEKQREYWYNYFTTLEGVDKVVFFSAKVEIEENEKEMEEKINVELNGDKTNEISSDSESENENDLIKSKNLNKEESENKNDNEIHPSSKATKPFELFNVTNLISVLKSTYTDQLPELAISLVGYPNVGKSSTINAIKGQKCVSVSATPGKTKHYQTIKLPDDQIVLYDCPGLVLPNTANTRAELVINGILPIDQLRDWRAPVHSVCNLVEKKIFEHRYGLNLNYKTEYEKANNLATGTHVKGNKLLYFLAKSKGFAVKGRADESRAARIILKDFVKGNLLYVKSPPNLNPSDDEIFQKETLIGEIDEEKSDKFCEFNDYNNNSSNKVEDTPNFDNQFFQKSNVTSHIRGKNVQLIKTGQSGTSLPSKKENRTKNKNKREKTRRLRKKDDDPDYY